MARIESVDQLTDEQVVEVAQRVLRGPESRIPGQCLDIFTAVMAVTGKGVNASDAKAFAQELEHRYQNLTGRPVDHP